MESIYKMAVACAVAVVMILTLKQRSGELAAMLSLASCAIVLGMGMNSVRTALTWFREIGSENGIDPPLISAVLKVCGIGVLSQCVAVFCRDAGEGSLAKIVEFCAGATAICVMLPFMDSAMDTVEKLLGG